MIGFIHTQKHMLLPERIERAVQSSIDPMEEMPFLVDCPVEEISLLLEEYIAAIEAQLLEVIATHGGTFLDSNDAAGLTAVCIAEGIDLPPDTLLRTCQAIVENTSQQSEYITELPSGESIYMVALEL